MAKRVICQQIATVGKGCLYASTNNGSSYILSDYPKFLNKYIREPMSSSRGPLSEPLSLAAITADKPSYGSNKQQRSWRRKLSEETTEHSSIPKPLKLEG